MRVTNWMLLNTAVRELDDLRAQYAKAQKKVYGRSLERPSDDPQRVVEAIDLTAMKVKLERAQRAATDAKEWLSIVETSLTAMAEDLQAAQETMIQFGSPANQEPSAKQNLALQIEALRDAIKREMNAQHRGRYLFAGWATDQVPFVDDGAGGVEYKGSSHKIEREIAPGYKVAINVPGDMLPHDIIATLTEVAEEIRAGNVSRVTGELLGKVKDAADVLLARRSEVGLAYQQVEQFEGYSRDGLITVEERLGEISGGDIADAVMQMTQAQQAYQVALSAFAMALPKTLMDYMFR
mgnify:FL=1